MRVIRVMVVLLGVVIQACVSPGERWESNVRAEIDATTFAIGDSLTVTLTNESGELRYATRCWALLRLETDKWLRVTTMPAVSCSPSYTIAPSGSVQERIGIWMTDLGPSGTGTFRIWYTVYAPGGSPDIDGDFVSTPSFVVQNP